MPRTTGREIEEKRAHHGDDSIDDADKVNPSPRCVDIEERCQVRAESAPGYVDTKLSPANSDTTCDAVVSFERTTSEDEAGRLCGSHRYLLGSSSTIPG